jgi:hypothetical protein
LLVEQGGDGSAVAEPIFVGGLLASRVDGEASDDVADVRVRAIHAAVDDANSYGHRHTLSRMGLLAI